MTTIERALELARIGTARTVDDIRAQLKREGFESVQAHLSGRTVQRQLRALMNKARP